MVSQALLEAEITKTLLVGEEVGVKSLNLNNQVRNLVEGEVTFVGPK